MAAVVKRTKWLVCGFNNRYYIDIAFDRMVRSHNIEQMAIKCVKRKKSKMASYSTTYLGAKI